MRLGALTRLGAREGFSTSAAPVLREKDIPRSARTDVYQQNRTLCCIGHTRILAVSALKREPIIFVVHFPYGAMAPKKKPAAAAAAARTVATTGSGAAATPTKKRGQVQIVKPFLRGKAAANAYYSSIAEMSDGASAKQVHTVIDGLKNVCVRDLKGESSFTIPGIATYTMKTTQAQAARKVSGDGWSYATKAKSGGCKRVQCRVLSALEQAIL